MKTSTEMSQVSFDNATSELHLAQIRTIKHYAKQGEFEEVFYGSPRDHEHMVNSASLLADLGFKTEVVKNKESDGEEVQFELHISWKDNVSWASGLYKEIYHDAVFYNLYLNSSEGKLLRNIVLKATQEAHCGQYTATVDIPSDLPEEVIERTQAMLEGEPLNYTCIINTARTKMTLSWGGSYK